jgi:hypothetical protein
MDTPPRNYNNTIFETPKTVIVNLEDLKPPDTVIIDEANLIPASKSILGKRNLVDEFDEVSKDEYLQKRIQAVTNELKRLKEEYDNPIPIELKLPFNLRKGGTKRKSRKSRKRKSRKSKFTKRKSRK